MTIPRIEGVEQRVYDPAHCVVFRKATEHFGGFSNMASGFPLEVNGYCIRTSEVLYQSFRYPHLPEVQEILFSEASPISAKRKTACYRARSRQDWKSVRVKVMRWCLAVKLTQNWDKFNALLARSSPKPIVESSSRDRFWGAIPEHDGTLIGANVLGRLLMELRAQVLVKKEPILLVPPPPIPGTLLYGVPIQAVYADRGNESVRLALPFRDDR